MSQKKQMISGGKRSCERLRLIRLYWFGGRCMWTDNEGKQCEVTISLELAHAEDTDLSIAKKSGRSSWERLVDVMEHPECFLLFCPNHHMKFDNRTSVMWIGDYYAKVEL